MFVVTLRCCQQLRVYSDNQLERIWNGVDVYSFISNAAPPFASQEAQKEQLDPQPGPPVFVPLSEQRTPEHQAAVLPSLIQC
jgi:hypothetical protein